MACWITILLFFVLLGLVAWSDWRTMRIPDRLNAAIFAVGVCAVFTVPGPTVAERILGIFAVSVPMLLAGILVPGGFGGGDIKLMAAGGLFLGVEGILAAALFGFFAGGVCALFLVIFRKAGRRDVFPFGPCLCGGMMASFVILCICGSYHII